MTRFFSAIVCGSMLMLFTPTAQAAVYNSTADADASTRQSGGGDDNAGAGTTMDAGATNADPNLAYYNVFIQWNLPGDLAGATINSATLTAQIRNMGASGAAGNYGLQAYTQAWVEGDNTAGSGVTSKTYDGTNLWPGGIEGGFADRVNVAAVNTNFDVQNIAQVDFTGGVAGTVVFDAKTLVEYWAGGGANNGVAIQAIGSQVSSINFWARESGFGGTVLDIDYTPIPEPASLALLGLGGLMLLRRRRK